MTKVTVVDLNQRKARISLSYIEAVASHAGFQVVEPKVDYDSVDGVLMGDFGRRPRIEFQAKATARDVVRDDHIHFQLPKKNYDDLRIEAINPRILIVMIVPNELHHWVDQSHEELTLRHCAYWHSIAGHPSSSATSNVTVRVPMRNMLTGDQLARMMEATERTGTL